MKWIIFTWYDCNESCFFCSAEVHGRKHLNRSFLEIAEDIVLSKQAWHSEIEFIGGEVLLRKDIELILAFARKNGFQTISIETNGTRLSDKSFCERVLSLGLNKITISIHGSSRSVNDRHTGLQGSFEKKILWIQHLQELHGRYQFMIASNYVITSKNIHEVPSFIRMMDQYPMFDKYIFAFVRPLNSYKKMYWFYLPTFDEIRSTFESFPIHAKVNLQYFPKCILKKEYREAYQDIFTKWKKTDTQKFNTNIERINLESSIQWEMIYLDDCRKCQLKESCRWVWKEYVKHYHITNMTPILDI